MQKVKMDKVRRLLGNRYGEDVKDGMLAMLQHMTEVMEVQEGNEVMAKALDAWKDVVARASKEPTVVEVDDAE